MYKLHVRIVHVCTWEGPVLHLAHKTGVYFDPALPGPAPAPPSSLPALAKQKSKQAKGLRPVPFTASAAKDTSAPAAPQPPAAPAAPPPLIAAEHKHLAKASEDALKTVRARVD